MEVPSGNDFNATTFAGAQDLVNNIISGVLDPDPRVSPVARADKHDEAGESRAVLGSDLDQLAPVNSDPKSRIPCLLPSLWR